ncbi:hypothetical protein FGO68_gene5516 [Halteria grandinella]|uniref:Uncharacterized protein n=1 Tax=Halteria grandinella TaxID=5974 RepID=A0A8J8T1D4_HALGN|nr:hypothetical protein FGO68_gene5516 [Halteria grandinella]
MEIPLTQKDQPSQQKTWRDQVMHWVRFFTLGKYDTGLSFRSRQQHVSILGSLVTIVAFLIISYLSFLVIDEIIHRRSRKFHITQVSDIIKYDQDEFYRKLDIFIQMIIGFTDEATRPDLNRSDCFNEVFRCHMIIFPSIVNLTCIYNKYSNDQVNQQYFISEEGYHEIQQKAKRTSNYFTIVCGCVDDSSSCPFGETSVNYDYYFQSFYFDQSQSIRETLRGNSETAKLGEFHTYKYTALILNSTDDYLQIFGSKYNIEKYFQVNSPPTIDKSGKGNSFGIYFQMDTAFMHAEVITSEPRSLASGLAQIGGYLSFFGLSLVILRIYHKRLMHNELQKYSLQTVNKHRIEHFSHERYTEMSMELAELKKFRRDIERRFNNPSFISGEGGFMNRGIQDETRSQIIIDENSISKYIA